MIRQFCSRRREANPVRGENVAMRVAIRRPPDHSTPRGPGDASGGLGDVTGGSNESQNPLSMRMSDLNQSCDCVACAVGSPCIRTGACGGGDESGLGTTRSEESKVQNFGEMPQKSKKEK